jgi:putative spermidine/putrescine transport system ATP-binding protein
MMTEVPRAVPASVLETRAVERLFGRTGAEVSLRGLTRYYGDVVAALDLNLTINAGEFVTLLGPSGSGKTTTLMMLAGFVEPSAGDILIDGRSVVDLPPHRRDIGVVFQNYALFPHMSVFDNVAFPLRMRHVGRPTMRQRVQEALDMVQLGDLGQRRINQLSGGQQQRVALARALVFQPPLLLMDEPLGALDRKLREQMQIEIKRIQHALGVTVVYVTHDQDEALMLSDRIAVMNTGTIHQVGTPDEIYEQPATAFVAEFVGESNFLDGLVEAVAAGGVTVRLPGGVCVHGPAMPVEKGQRLKVMIRPEVLRLRTDLRSDADNAVDGVVEEVVYLGQAIGYTVRIGELVLTAREPRLPGMAIFSRGARVTVTWPRAATFWVA